MAKKNKVETKTGEPGIDADVMPADLAATVARAAQLCGRFAKRYRRARRGFHEIRNVLQPPRPVASK